MEYQEITFTKWKNLNKIFYSRGIHIVRMYANGEIELTNFQGRKFNYRVLSNVDEGNQIGYGIQNLNSNSIGSLVLKSNGVAILVFENGRGMKFKR